MLEKSAFNQYMYFTQKSREIEDGGGYENGRTGLLDFMREKSRCAHILEPRDRQKDREGHVWIFRRN